MKRRGGLRRVLMCPPSTVSPPAGACARPCADCQRELWVGGDEVEFVDGGMVDPLCASCVHAVLARSDGAQLGMLPGHQRVYSAGSILPGMGQDIPRGTAAYELLMSAIEDVARDEL